MTKSQYMYINYDTFACTCTCSIVCHLVSHETHLNPGRQALPPTTIILFEISQRQSIGHCSNEEHITIPSSNQFILSYIVPVVMNQVYIHKQTHHQNIL